MARIVGELGVEITADATGLAEDIKAKVEAAVREAATSQIALSVNTTSLARQIKDAIAQAKAAVGNLKIGVELFDDGFLAAVETEVKKAQELAGSIRFGVELNVAGIDQAQLEAEVRKSLAEAQAGTPALKIKIELDSTGLLESVKIAVAEVQAAAKKVKLGFDIDASGLAAKVKIAAEIASEAATIKPKVDPKTAEADFESFSRKIADGMGKTGSAITSASSAIFTSISKFAIATTAAVGVAQLGVSLVQLSGAAGLLPGVLFSAVGAIAALKIGTEGFGTAVKDIGTPQFAGDLAKLAPSARDTALAIAGIKPALEGLKLDVQQQLFAGFGNSIRTLSTTLLPVLNTGLSGFAATLNVTVHQLDAFFASASTRADLANVFNSAQASVFNLGQALPAVLSIFRDLTVVGSDAFAQLTGGAQAATQKVADFIAQSRQSGSLANFVDDGVAAFRQLFTIIGNVVSIVDTLIGAIGGGGILGLLVQLTSSLKDFLNSAQGTAALQALGAAMQQIAGTVGQVFLTLLQALADLLTQHAGDIATFVKALGEDLVSAITTLEPVISGLLTVIGQNPDLFANLAIGVGVLGIALNALVPIATVIAALIAAGIPGLVVAIVAAVIAAVVLVILNFDKIKAAISTALDAIGAFFVFLGGVIANAFQSSVSFVVGIWNGVVAFFVGIGTSIANAVSTAVTAVGQFFTDGFNAVVTFVGGVINSIVTFFVNLPGQIGAFIATIPATVAATLQQLAFDFGFTVGAILRFFVDLPQQIINAIGTLLIDIGIFTIQFGTLLLNGIVNGFNAVIDFVVTAPGQIINAVAALAIDIYNWGIGVWVQANIAFLNGVRDVINFALTVPGQVINAVTGLITQIAVWALNVWIQAQNAFGNGVRAVVNFAINLPGQVISAIGNLGPRLFQVGVDALNGLINGIKSIVGKLLDFVGGLVSDVIHGFTSGFDSHSPSRKTYAIGQDVAQGLANALLDSRQLVSDAAGDLANAGLAGLDPLLNPTVNTAAVANGLSSAAGGLTSVGSGTTNFTVQQTNVMQQGTDVNQFADTVWKNGAAVLASGSSLLGVSQLGTQAGINPNFVGSVAGV